MYELRLPLSALQAQRDVNSAPLLRTRKELSTKDGGHCFYSLCYK